MTDTIWLLVRPEGKGLTAHQVHAFLPSEVDEGAQTGLVKAVCGQEFMRSEVDRTSEGPPCFACPRLVPTRPPIES